MCKNSGKCNSQGRCCIGSSRPLCEAADFSCGTMSCRVDNVFGYKIQHRACLVVSFFLSSFCFPPGAQRTIPRLQEDVLGRCCRCVWSQASRSQEMAECTPSYHWAHTFQHHAKCSSRCHGCNTHTAAAACSRSECIQVIIASYCSNANTYVHFRKSSFCVSTEEISMNSDSNTL